MTTIVYRDGVIAADSRVVSGGDALGTVRKIARNGNGDLAGAAGSAVFSAAFLNWFTSGEPAGLNPKAEDKPGGVDRAFIVRSGSPGVIEIYEGYSYFKLYDAPYYTCGSGRPEALGALYMGATAVQAVQAAARFDVHTGGDIVVERMERSDERKVSWTQTVQPQNANVNAGSLWKF